MAEAKKAKPKAGSEKSPAKSKAAKPKPKPEARVKAAPKSEAASDKPTKKPAKPKSAPRSKSHSLPETYSDPALRDRIKEKIMAGDEGGKPGQWSARKAQLLAVEYKKEGGDYKNDKEHKTESQAHLDSWTKEDWKTSDDKPADREGGTTRYLPAEAWDKLTPAEKKATNAKKQAGSKEGEQFVANTDKARTARKSATKSPTKAKPKPKAKAEPKAEAKEQPNPKPKAKAKAAPKGHKKSSD